MDFSHLDKTGRAKMVDVSDKPVIRREAVAKGEIFLSANTMKAIKDKKVPKGDVLTVAKVAAIQAGKKASELIPMCHPLPISQIEVKFEIKKDRIAVESKIKGEARTGFEMEALTAVSAACLTIYDMCKAVDKNMVIQNIRLVKKWKAA